jgi:23S rRNA (adenine2503-C2)-methyltransferase
MKGIKIAQKVIGSDAIRYVLLLKDNNVIEAVSFSYKGTALCISSQVGCPIKCVFCRTGQDPFRRNLNTREIIEEVFVISKDLDKKIDVVSYMGMGEQLLNYEHVVEVIRYFHKSPTFSNSRILLSTVGIPEKIYALTKENLPISLYFSLHAVTDEKRSKLIPISYPLKEIFEALNYYDSKIKAEEPLTIVYLLLKRVNDSKDELKGLSKLLELIKSRNFHVILKNYCYTGLPFEKSPNLKLFAEALEKAHISYRISYRISESYGQGIEGGCGQLRQRILSLGKLT